MPYSVTTISNTDDFLELRNEWKLLYEVASERDYYFSHDWFNPLLTGCSSLPNGRLTVFVCRRGGVLYGLFPCHIAREKKRFFKLNTLKLYGNIYTPRRGGLVRKGEERKVVNAFVDYLCNDFSTEWNLIDFENLSKKDFIVRLLTGALTQREIKISFHDQFDNVRTYLGGNGGEKFFVSLSKKLRQNIRTGINRFCKNGSIIIWLVDNNSQGIDSAMDDYYQVYDESWKEKEIDPDYHRKLAAYLATKNKLRLFILYYREGGNEDSTHPNKITSISDGLYVGATPPGKGYQPIAVNYFIVDDRVAYYLKTAYRGNFSKFSAGTVLFWFAVKHFIEIDQCSIIDHQQGKEEYKLKWGEVHETRYRLNASNPKSMLGKAEMWLDNSFFPWGRKIRTLFRK